jgi:hypothetical protein
MLRKSLPNACVIGFAWHLKRFVHGIYLGEQGFALDPDAFDTNKEEPQDLLGGMSWREVYIHYSERVIKPLHGDGWFASALVRAAIATGKDICVVPDSGFRAEAEEVVHEVGAKNVLLVRLHRGDIDFTGDSRNWVDLSDLGVPCYDFMNQEGIVTVSFMAERVRTLADSIWTEY